MSTYTDEPKQIQADLKGDGFTTVATNGSDIGPGSLESQQPDIEAEKRVLKKVDRHIIPVRMTSLPSSDDLNTDLLGPACDVVIPSELHGQVSYVGCFARKHPTDQK